MNRPARPYPMLSKKSHLLCLGNAAIEDGVEKKRAVCVAFENWGHGFDPVTNEIQAFCMSDTRPISAGV